MEIIRYVQNEVFEYHCMVQDTREGALKMSAHNCRHIDPTSEWGLVPMVVGIEGSLQGIRHLMDFLIRHAKSPVLAEVSSTKEKKTLERFEFFPFIGDFMVRELEGRVI